MLIYGLTQTETKKVFLTKYVQAGRRLQQPAVQTPACEIMALQNKASSWIWIHKGLKRTKQKRLL